MLSGQTSAERGSRAQVWFQALIPAQIPGRSGRASQAGSCRTTVENMASPLSDQPLWEGA